MEDEKHRRRTSQSNSKMLEKHKSKCCSEHLNNSLEQPSDEESFSNGFENQSMDLRAICNNESTLSRDMTYGSASMSEGDGDGDLEGLNGRVNKLKEELHMKEADYDKLHAEYEHLGANMSPLISSHSQNNSIIDKNNSESCTNKISVTVTEVKANFLENNTSSFENNQLQKCYKQKYEKLKKNIMSIVDKYKTEININNEKHKKEIQKLKTENIEEKTLYAKTLSNIKSKLNKNTSTIESLKSDVINYKDPIEKDLLYKQIELYKVQLDHVTKKKVANVNVLAPKNSIDHSFFFIKRDSLKLQSNDLLSKHSDQQKLIENSECLERNLNNQISLEKSLSRFSSASFTEMDKTTYQAIDRTTLQNQLTKKILDNQAIIEKAFQNKIDFCEKEDEMCEKNEMNESEKINELKKLINEKSEEVANHIQKIDDLRKINFNMENENNKLKKGLSHAYNECIAIDEQLNHTLEFEETNLCDSTTLLDQSEALDPSSFHLEHILQLKTKYNQIRQKLDSCQKQFDNCKRKNSELNQEIFELKDTIEAAQQKEEDYCKEIEVLKMKNHRKSEELDQLLLDCEKKETKFNQTKLDLEYKHTQEIEKLRNYFEENYLPIGKQYHEEVLSLKSKKMLDNDSEAEELNDDLNIDRSTIDYLAGGDAKGIVEQEVKNVEFLGFIEPQKNNFCQKIVSNKDKREKLPKELFNVVEKCDSALVLKTVNQFCQTNESRSTRVENNELNELRAHYDRQLKEEVELARDEFINLVQQQIEAAITDDSESNKNFGTELLELRKILINKAEMELQTMKQYHGEEIKHLKEENNKDIYDLQEQVKRLTTEALQNNFKKERDTLHKICETLKDVIFQLVVYFKECEEELNSTLINEILKKQIVHSDNNLHLNDNQITKVKRVHFAPQSEEIASIIGSDNDLQNLINSEEDVKKMLQSDLDARFERFKNDSNKILNTSYSDSESWSTGPCENPIEKSIEVEKLLADSHKENECLKVKIIELQRLLLAKGTKESISEAYGLQDEGGFKELQVDLSELLDRAKYIVMNGSNDIDYLLQLIEELYKHAEKSIEDRKREKEDLQHQISLVPTPPPNIHRVHYTKIEAADKQLRLTRKFQEEQAVEREMEREEATKQIQQMQENLRERERKKDRDYQINFTEVEALTLQLRETELKKTELEGELKSAVSKKCDLRKIVHDLKQQLQLRSDKEDSLNNQIEHLKEIIISQTKNQEKLVQELEVVKSGNENNQFSDHIGYLQEELQKHRLNTEQFTANALTVKYFRYEIRDMQLQIDRKTRELECLHVCSSSLSLSQPSEDVSIREQIDATRCPTPDDPSLMLVLPPDHLLKLKETLLKHFRAEDVVLKRLKDLDVQYSGLQRQNEELLAEQEILHQTTSEQLFRIETLRARLEQQKQNAPFAQRQATSKLESQLYDINEKLKSSERALTEKDMELAELKDQLKRMSRILAEKESKIANVVQSENDIIQNLRAKLEIVEDENLMMKAKFNIQEKTQNNLPQLIENMIGEKNEEIEHLKERVNQYEKQLDVYVSIDEIQFRELIRQNEQKNSARTLSDILSIKSDCDISEAIREAPNFSKSQNISNLRVQKSMAQSIAPQSKKDFDLSHDIAETPRVPRLNIESFSSGSEGVSSNMIEISKEIEAPQLHICETVQLAPISLILETDNDSHDEQSEEANAFVCPRHHKFQKNTNEMVNEAMMVHRIQKLELHLSELNSELEKKSTILKEKETELLEIRNNAKQLEGNIESLNQDRLFYIAEFKMSKMNEIKIQQDLDEVENVLKKTTEELKEFKDKNQVNEQILHKETERSKYNEFILEKKSKEIGHLKTIINEKDVTIEKLKFRNEQIEKEIQDALKTPKNNFSRSSSANEKDQEIYHLQENIKKNDKVIRQMIANINSLHHRCNSLKIIQNKIKQPGNYIELRRKIKALCKINLTLKEEIATLRTQVEILRSLRQPEEENDVADMFQRQLNISKKLDQRLLNAVNSDPEQTLQNYGNLSQAKKEIEELNGLKNDLEIEIEMLKSQISEYEKRIMQLKNDAENEILKIRRLEEDLSKERCLVRSLQKQLQREKNIADEDKLKDTELISQLRIKLDEALEVKDRLVMEQKNIELMYALKDQDKNNSTDAQDQLKKELIAVTEKLEIQQSKYDEIQDNLQKLSNEKEHIEKRYETVETEVKRLKSNADMADLIKDQLKSDLKTAKEELKLKNEEYNCQKSILKTMKDAESKRNQRRINEHSELKNLRRELKNAQEVMFDFQADTKALNEQLSAAAEREVQLSYNVKSLLHKETVLNQELNEIKKENKKLKSIIVDQQNEIKIHLREIDLTKELKRDRLSIQITIQKLSQDNISLKEENDRYLDLIRILETQLAQIRHNHQSISKNDVQERMQYFYGKYLRSESRLKSLIYQKNYLLCILISFEQAEENSLATLARLTDFQRKISRGGMRHRYNPRIRFRTVILFIVAIQRMKWLVLRWRTGMRVGTKVVLNTDNTVADNFTNEP